MTKIAFMFPGQGSFEAGMGKDVAEAVPAAMAVYDEGSVACGLDLKKLCFDTPAEQLVDTEVQQPALVATSLALDAALRSRGIAPHFVVGHSVGEFAALGSANALSTPARRWRSCASAVRRWPTRRASIPARWRRSSGSPTRRSRRCARRSRECGPPTTTARASSSSPARRTSVDEACVEAEREGARRAVKLRVSGAFHSPLVGRAAERLRPAIEKVHLREGGAAFMSTVTAKIEDVQRYGELLVEQLTAPVRFTQAARALVEQGVTTFVEVGPGNVLSGLLKRIDSSARTLLGQGPRVARPCRRVACLTRRRSRRCRVDLPSSPGRRAASAVRSPASSHAPARRSLSAIGRGGRRPSRSPTRSAVERCRQTSRHRTTRSAWSTRRATSTCSSTTPG